MAEGGHDAEEAVELFGHLRMIIYIMLNYRGGWLRIAPHPPIMMTIPVTSRKIATHAVTSTTVLLAPTRCARYEPNASTSQPVSAISETQPVALMRSAPSRRNRPGCRPALRPRAWHSPSTCRDA